MQTVYKVLAFVIVGLVAVQAASHAWLSAGLVKFLAEGGSIDFSDMAGLPPFTEAMGLMIHAMNGMYVIPLVAIVLLVVGLVSKSSQAVIWAGVVAVLVALQVTLGLLGHSMTAFSFLHGINAIVLAVAALTAGLRVHLKAPDRTASHATAHV